MTAQQVHPNTLTAALVVVARAGEVLLVQEAEEPYRGMWFLPGGRAMIGESITDTAIREVREESGLAVELTGLLYVDQLVEGPANRLRFVFVARPVGGQLKQAEDEHTIRAAWVPLSEIGELATRSPFVDRMVTLIASEPTVLPMASCHVLTEEDKVQERP
ncbi:MAG: NUDIX domain-containing protein [Chloroflexi bacterium]|nr:NUDIX domain-containing protein [Chloroflexota bacterium]MBU1748624.1 NUDIX domain-containing protein [Chloroflexota bacterium]MBU1880090.1 NUDIX domain-containing protein [Chloroflexota bacterium]